MGFSECKFEREFDLFLKKNFSHLKKNKSKFNIIRVDIPLNIIWKYNSYLAKLIFFSPEKFLFIAEKSLNKIVHLLHNLKKKFIQNTFYYKVNLTGPFGYEYTTIISLKACCIGELVCVKGYVVFCFEKELKRKLSVFFCEKNDKLYIKNEDNDTIYTNPISLNNLEYCNMEIEYGLSRYFEMQKIIVYGNQLNKYNKNSNQNLIVYVDRDLIEKYNIGDQIEACGIFKPLKIKNLSEKYGLFETYLSTFSLKKIEYNDENFVGSKLDFFLISYFSMFSDCFEKLSSLVAPQIQGIDLIKKSVLLTLVHSNKKKNTPMISLNESINLLLIGDYNLIKNELLSFISSNFPIYSLNNYKNLLSFPKNENIGKSRNSDSILKLEKFLKFLKNDFVFFDDLEKLSYRNKISLAEILEKGVEIKLDKNISTVNHICPTVIGCVKTVNRDFDLKTSTQDYIGFPEVLFNQFDIPLLLPNLILTSKEQTEAKLVLNNHRFSKNRSSFAKDKNNNWDDFGEEVSFMENKRVTNSNKDFLPVNFQEISNNFLNNYIRYVKSEVRCFLSKDVVDFIINSYYRLKISPERFTKNGIRIFETIVRLCLSFTKCHLRELVSIKDVEYISKFLNTVNETRFQINCNKSRDLNDKKTDSNKKKSTSMYIEIEEDVKLKWSNFEILKIKSTTFINIEWNFQTIRSTSFKIKKFLKHCKFNSHIERALFNWNYKNKCIIIGRDLIKI